MDGRPFRVTRSVENRAATRSQSVASSQAVTQPAVSEPAHTTNVTPDRPLVSRTDRHPKRRIPKLTWLITGLLIAALFVIGYLYWSQNQSKMAIDTSKYQAVSITDGQVYFGKLSNIDGQYVKLTGAYYLQPQADNTSESKENQPAEATQSSVKLVKLSNKIYGPDDEIIISRSEIISFENLKSDGQVAKWLEKNSASN